jgi:hypothetical protein
MGREIRVLGEHLVHPERRNQHVHDLHLAGLRNEHPAAGVLPVRQGHVIDENEIAIERNSNALVPGADGLALVPDRRPGKHLLAFDVAVEDLAIDEPGGIGRAGHGGESHRRNGKQKNRQQLQVDLPFLAGMHRHGHSTI